MNSPHLHVHRGRHHGVLCLQTCPHIWVWPLRVSAGAQAQPCHCQLPSAVGSPDSINRMDICFVAQQLLHNSCYGHWEIHHLAVFCPDLPWCQITSFLPSFSSFLSFLSFVFTNNGPCTVWVHIMRWNPTWNRKDTNFLKLQIVFELTIICIHTSKQSLGVTSALVSSALMYFLCSSFTRRILATWATPLRSTLGTITLFVYTKVRTSLSSVPIWSGLICKHQWCLIGITICISPCIQQYIHTVNCPNLHCS